MRKISLKKLDPTEITVLQSELRNMISYYSATISPRHNNYFDRILLIDIAQKMYYNFRGKFERATKETVNLNLEPHEACVLLQCCNYSATLRNGFEIFVLQKYSRLLHKELTELS